MLRTALVVALLASVTAADAQTPIDAEQAALLREFERFEENLLKTAEQARRSDPQRVDLIRRARGLSSERRILSDMKRAVELLSGDAPRYGTAAEQQEQLVASLEVVLKLLQTEDQRERLEEEKDFYERLLKETDRLIAKQRDLRADTDRGKNKDDISEDQQALAEDAQSIEEEIDERAKPKSDQTPGEKRDADGQKPTDPSESDPKRSESEESDSEKSDGEKSDAADPQGGPKSPPKPGDPPPAGEPQDTPPTPPSGQPPQESSESKPPPVGKEQLQKARREMERAIEQLQKDAQDEAGEAQDEAVEELERLKAELQKILRQLREEEDEIRLTLLEARFQQMLQEQLRVNAATKRLDRTDEAERVGPFLTSAAELSRDEQEIITEAERALRLLREEGSSAAFPEAVSQARDSMKQVASRLSDADVGSTTQLIEEMVVEALEELIVALQKELDEKQQKPQDGDSGEQMTPQQQQLVDKLAELKLIRSLQAQVNRMTEQFDASTAGKDLTDADRKFAADLARRQERIQRITYEMSTNRGQ